MFFNGFICVAVAVRGAALQGLGAQVLRQHIRYEAAVHLVCRGAGTLKARSTLHVSMLLKLTFL